MACQIGYVSIVSSSTLILIPRWSWATRHKPIVVAQNILIYLITAQIGPFVLLFLFWLSQFKIYPITDKLHFPTLLLLTKTHKLTTPHFEWAHWKSSPVAAADAEAKYIWRVFVRRRERKCQKMTSTKSFHWLTLSLCLSVWAFMMFYVVVP